MMGFPSSPRLEANLHKSKDVHNVGSGGGDDDDDDDGESP